MPKNHFEAIAQLHKEDVERDVISYSDSAVAISTHLISLRRGKQGTIVEMGAGHEVLTEFLNDNNKRLFILVSVDREKLNQIQNS